MPDFAQIALELAKKRKAEQAQNGSTLQRAQQIQENIAGRKNQNLKPAVERTDFDATVAQYGDDPTGQSLYAENKRVTEDNPYLAPYVGQQWNTYDDQGNETNHKSAMAQTFLNASADSLQKGIGDLVTRYGGIAQMIGAGVESFLPDKTFGQAMAEGNYVSRAMQELGEDIVGDLDKRYITPDIQNPEFKFSTFLNPDFWSIHGAAFIPQLAEIIATDGVAKAITNSAEKGAAKLFAGAIESAAARGAIEGAVDTAEAAQKAIGNKMDTVFGSVRNVTKDQFGRKGVYNSLNKGSGLLGVTMTDAGKFTTGFGQAVHTVTAGALTNLSVGLGNGAEMFNTYRNVYETDANGQTVIGQDGKPKRAFTDQELGEMAKDVFATNLQYMAADVISWGLVYGKGMNKVIGAVDNLIPGQIKQLSAGLMSKPFAPVFKRAAKLGLKAGFEGFEESIQEAYEDWTQMKAYHDVHGSMKGYQRKLTQDYQFEDDTLQPFSKGFWDYWQSKDSESTRAIAFALGMATGGAFNVGDLFNKHANTVSGLEDRLNIVNQVDGTPGGKANQQKHIYYQMVEAVNQGKGMLFQEYVNKLYQDNKITEEELARHAATFAQVAANYEAVKPLNLKGQKAYMFNVANEIRLNEDMEQHRKVFEEKVNGLGKAKANSKNMGSELYDHLDIEGSFNKKEEEALTDFKYKIIPIAKRIAEVKENQRNLLLEESAKPVDINVRFDYDPLTGDNTLPVYIESDRDPDAKPEEVTPEQKKKAVDEFERFDKKASNLWNSAKGIFNEALSKGKKMFSGNPDQNQDANTDPTVPAPGQDIQQATEGSIDALRQSVQGVDPTEEEITNLDSQINDKTNDIVDNVKKAQQLRKEGKTDEANALTEKNAKQDQDIEALKQHRQERNDLLEENKKKNQPTNESQNQQEDQKNNPQQQPQPKTVQNEETQTKKLDPVSDEEYKKFVDNGDVTEDRINDIAKKITSNEKLDPKEEAIFSNKTTEVNNAISNQKNESNNSNPSPESNISDVRKSIDEQFKGQNISPEERAQIEQMAMNQDKLNNKTETKETPAPKKKNVNKIDDDIFGVGRSQKEQEQDTEAKVNKKPILKRLGDVVNSIKDKAYKGISRTGSLINDDYHDPGFGTLAETIVVSNLLKEMYPDVNPNVYAIPNMMRVIGTRDLGYMLAGQIYIRENQWNQGTTLMHEVSHIYYQLSKNEPEARKMTEFALQDRELVKRLLRDYDDQIEYKLQDGTVVQKRDLFDDYAAKSQPEIDDTINNLLSQGKITTIPLREQSVIAEEAFVAKLEGPMSEDYNMYFEKDNTRETERQFYAKKWWNKLKKKGENVDRAQRKAFFESLNDVDKKKYSDTLESVQEAIANGIKGKDLSNRGRSQRISSMNEDITDRLNQIEKEIEIERNNILDQSTLAQRVTDSTADQLIDDLSFETLFNSESDYRLDYSNKLTDIIKNFANVYNKGITVINRMNENRTNWRRPDYLNSERLRYRLSEIAKESWSGADYIRRLRDSSHPEIDQFMTYMDNTNRGDMNHVLQTLYWHENNITNTNAMQTYIDQNGNSKIEISLNQKEKSLVENSIDGLNKMFTSSKRNENPTVMQNYKTMMDSATNIYNGNYTDQDIRNIVEIMTDQKLDTDMILENNRININGKVFPLDAAVVNFVERSLLGRDLPGPQGQFGNFTETLNGTPLFGLYKNNEMKDSVRVFLRSLINENRKYTSNYTVSHADGTQHSSRMVDNFLQRGFKAMKDDVNRMSKQEFFDFYSSLNAGKKGARSNALLNFIYDKVKQGGDIDLIENGGIRNDYNDGKTSAMKESDSTTERLQQFIIFNNTAKKSSYLMDLGRFSDASRSFYMEVPRVDSESLFTIKDGRAVFSNKAIIENAYNTHQALGYKGTQQEFKNMIDASVKNNIKFLNDNAIAFKNDQNMGKYYTKGKLNKEGQLFAADYEINQIINGANFTEAFFPSFEMRDKKDQNVLIKRAKSAMSPMFSFPNVQLENIYIGDIEQDGHEVTDAGFYVLEDDAAKFTAAGGTIMPLGNAFKLIQTGVERYNPSMKGKNVYNKGYATILNDEVVLKNPKLKGAYELLKARKEKYENQFGKSSNNLLDGTTNYIPMIVPTSSNKSKNLLPGFYDTQNTMSFESLNTALDGEFGLESANQILDQLNYDQNGDFIGMSGENFGIQQVMDIDRETTNTPIQLIKALTTNMSLNGKEEQVQSMLNEFKNLAEKQIQEGYNIIETGTNQEVKEFLKKLMDPNKIDQNQKAILFDDNSDIKVPYVRDIVKNTVANYIKQNGLKLKTPGAVLREKPSTFEKHYSTSSDLDSTHGSKDLSFYRQNTDGTVSPGEVVLPQNMVDEMNNQRKNKLTPREYLADNGKSLENNRLEAIRKAKDRKVGYGKVFNDSGTHVGYYVEGDRILASRIPSHGVQSSGIFEFVDTTGEKGNNIQLPNQFKKIIGSDNDGDQIFVQYKAKGNPEWNSIFDKIVKQYLDPEMQQELSQEIDFENDARQALNEVSKVYGESKSDFVLPYSSQGRENAFKDTMVAKNNVGRAANLHTTLRMFGNYGVKLNNPIVIDNVYADAFTDVPNESVTIKSAKIFNIILDNAKSGYADKLGINSNTINMAMVLSNLNYDLDKVAVILNHPMVKRYSELRDGNTNIFNKDEKLNVMDELKREFEIKKPGRDVTINTKDTNGSNNSIFNLIQNSSQMESEISNIAAVLSIHNNISVNPFEIDTILDKFNKTMNGENNKQISIPQDFRNNPVVENYVNVLQKNRNVQEKVDPVFSGDLRKVHDDIANMSTKEFSKEDFQTLSDALTLFNTSQILGWNNIDRSVFEGLTAKDNQNNIFNKLQDHINDMKSNYVYYNQEQPLNSITSYDNSILLSKALSYSTAGRNQFISLNNDFMQNMVDNHTRERLVEEFNNLPEDLQNDLMMYDLMKNGWNGPLSMYPLFPQGVKNQVSVNSGKITQNSDQALNLLKNRIIMNNDNLLRTYDMVSVDPTGKLKVSLDISSQNSVLLNKFIQGKPFMFKVENEGKQYLVRFDGLTKEEHNSLQQARENNNDAIFYKNYLIPQIEKNMKRYNIKKSENANLDYISIKNESTLNPDPNGNQRYNEIVSKRDNNEDPGELIRKAGRSQRRDYYNFNEELDRKTYDFVMEYSPNVSEDQKQSLYENYLQERKKANMLEAKINPDTVKSMSSEKLLALFDSNKDLGQEYGGGLGFGLRNKFAYSNIIKPIIQELATRAATEQSKLTGREYDGNDIGILKKYFMTNNIPSNHPAVQYAVRNMETQYKEFLKERNKYISEVNEATAGIYMEKFGYNPYDKRSVFKNLQRELFANKESLYKELYGPLMTFEVIKDEKGREITNMKYKTPAEIEQGVNNGSITPAQKKFYDVTRGITENLKEFGLGDHKSRQDYIPHSAPSSFEALSRRGLLGLMVNSKTLDQRINDVKMDLVNPFTGQLETGVDFKTVTDWYNTISRGENGRNHAISYYKLKKKAIELNKKGINQDGSPIRQSNVEINSALGDTFMDRFSSSRSIKSTDFPTLDLNKAFVDYTHATLFNHGNENFAGFKKMVPLIDGIISQLDRNGNNAMSEYVDKVWKQYFLGGAKQQSFKTPSFLSAAGITTDNVVDYITKGSLIYWLGWKGLAMGAGAYAIGNVLVGKFNNVIDTGGKNWINGEKKFWLGKDGKFDITDPFKGIREANEILKNSGFMDINIYDNVNIEQQNSIGKTLMSMALMPMTWSEKWIQGVHFLSKLSNEEWESLKEGNPMDSKLLTEREDSIKQFHGKGYTPTDQRMIQMYSWGRAMMQFNRYIPTMFNTLFAKEDIDIYGNKTMGNYTAVYKTIQRGINGEWSPTKWANYYKSLDKNEQKKLSTGLASVGLISALAAINTFSKNSYIDKFISDSHLVLDMDRLSGRLTPRPLLAFEDIIK